MSRDRRDAEADERESEPSGRRHGHRLLKVALLGGAVALLVSEDLRKQLLDLLFGAEEEFDYSSTTAPAEPAPETTSDTQPRRAGWWSRRFGGGE